MKHYRVLIVLLALILPATVIALADEDVRSVRHYADQSDLSSSRVDGAVQDGRGLMWFSTWNGLDCFDGYDFHWVKMQPGDGACVENDRIRQIQLADDGNILCYTYDGVFEFDLATYTFRNIPKKRQQELMKLKGHISEDLWKGMTDSQGNFWTADINGIYKTTYTHHPAKLLKEMGKQHVRAFMLDNKKRLWMGTRREMGITVFGSDGKMLHHAEIGFQVFFIKQTRNGAIWIGTKSPSRSNVASVMFKVNPETFAIEKRVELPDVYDIQEDQYGRLWIASFTQGVKCYTNPDADAPAVMESFGGKRVRKIHITPMGNVIAATSTGLLVGKAVKNAKQIKMRAIKRDGNDYNSLASNTIIDIEQDRHGNLFIGTASSGVDMIAEEDLMAPKPHFRHFSARTSSLMSDFVSALTFFDNSTLMVVSNTNVMLFNPYLDNTINYNSVFFCDSCRFSEGKPIKMPDGTWLFGTERGTYSVTPDDMLSRGYIPPLIWSYVEVNGGAEDFSHILNDTLRLGTDERNVRIGFAAIDYVDNTGILYRTRLGDSPWTYGSSDRSISLFDMKPGTYVLQVQSTDRYGRWVDNMHTLYIIVKPHWYETLWAKLLLATLIIAIAAGIFLNFIYIRRLKAQQQEALHKYMKLLNAADEHTDGNEDSVEPKPHQEDEEAEQAMQQFSPDDQMFLDKVRHFIEQNMANSDVTIDDMAAVTATSRSTLNRRLRSLLGITAAQLLIDARMQHAMQLLQQNPYLSVSDVAYRCGYSDPRYFSRSFKMKYGSSPSDYREVSPA